MTDVSKITMQNAIEVLVKTKSSEQYSKLSNDDQQIIFDYLLDKAEGKQNVKIDSILAEVIQLDDNDKMPDLSKNNVTSSIPKAQTSVEQAEEALKAVEEISQVNSTDTIASGVKSKSNTENQQPKTPTEQLKELLDELEGTTPTNNITVVSSEKKPTSEENHQPKTSVKQLEELLNELEGTTQTNNIKVASSETKPAGEENRQPKTSVEEIEELLNELEETTQTNNIELASSETKPAGEENRQPKTSVEETEELLNELEGTTQTNNITVTSSEIKPTNEEKHQPEKSTTEETYKEEIAVETKEPQNAENSSQNDIANIQIYDILNAAMQKDKTHKLGANIIQVLRAVAEYTARNEDGTIDTDGATTLTLEDLHYAVNQAYEEENPEEPYTKQKIEAYKNLIKLVEANKDAFVAARAETHTQEPAAKNSTQNDETVTETEETKAKTVEENNEPQAQPKQENSLLTDLYNETQTIKSEENKEANNIKTEHTKANQWTALWETVKSVAKIDTYVNEDTMQDFEEVIDDIKDTNISKAAIEASGATIKLANKPFKYVENLGGKIIDITNTDVEPIDNLISDGAGKVLKGGAGILTGAADTVGSVLTFDADGIKESSDKVWESTKEASSGVVNAASTLFGKGWLWGKDDNKAQ